MPPPKYGRHALRPYLGADAFALDAIPGGPENEGRTGLASCRTGELHVGNGYPYGRFRANGRVAEKEGRANWRHGFERLEWIRFDLTRPATQSNSDSSSIFLFVSFASSESSMLRAPRTSRLDAALPVRFSLPARVAWLGSLLLLAPLAAAEHPSNQLTEAEQRSGWKLLFDGKTLDGWRGYGNDTIGERWEVSEGELRHPGQKGAGDLITDQQYEYFELSLEYKISEGGNSGVLFRVVEGPVKSWHSGPEVQIMDDAASSSKNKSGWLYDLFQPVKPKWAIRAEEKAGLISPDAIDASRPAEHWNHLYLRVSALQSEVVLNGVHYFHFNLDDDEWNERVARSKFAKFPQFATAARGHIALQDHGAAVAFRNIKLRRLTVDDQVPDPSDGTLELTVEPAFPNLQWEDWDGIDERGRVRQLRPIVMTHADDGSNLLYVATQQGMIHVFEDDPATTQARLLLDLREKVADWKENNEEGLLGLALHPKYPAQPYLYVYYSSRSEAMTSIVARYSLSDERDCGDPDSELELMRIKQPYANHNGGSIAFGPDGYLYIGMGDGGSRNDPMNHGQNLETWLGSILRIDVDAINATGSYGIPRDNPFATVKGAKPEIFAYGIRNAWRLSFDEPTGTMWVADVGQDLWEEINLVVSGGNYGWSMREGAYLFGNRLQPPASPPIDPIWEYDHRIGRSITGGLVYRGTQLPELQGAYVYADYVLGKIWALYYDHEAQKVIKNLRIPSNRIPILAFGEGPDGEIIYSMATTSGQSLYRFVRP